MAIHSTLADASQLKTNVVMIDVFRSSNTIIELLKRGASKIYPVSELEQVSILKGKDKQALYFGERKGVRLEGTDGDNSPCQEVDVAKRPVILSTSAGTRCLSICKDKKVYIGSFANANALIEQLAKEDIKDDVSFWAAGMAGETPAEEDLLCAQMLEMQWHGEKINWIEIKEKLMRTSGAKRLRTLNQVRDLAYCTQLNHRENVPRVISYKGVQVIENVQ